MKLITAIAIAIMLPIAGLSIDFLSSDSSVLPASRGYSNAGRINQTVKFIADQLSQNKDFANISDSKIAITSFVNVENLKETSKIGNLISEHLIHDMQIRGYKVIDYKTMPDIEIGTNGDYAFSRQVKSLRQDISLNYILTGTYTFYADGLSINARIIDVQTNVVSSTAQAFVPKSDLRYILDSMSPMASMTNGGSSIPLDNSRMGEIVPGVEGSMVRIRAAKW